MKAIRNAISAVVLACLASASLPLGAASAADPYPPYISPTAPWLQVVNYYRAMAGVPPVTQTTVTSDMTGAAKHACYMLYNNIGHSEDPAKYGYSPEGAKAAQESNVAVSSALGASARSHIDLWMTGPFHAVGILRPALKTVAFGKCDEDSARTPTWHSGAALNVIAGLDNNAAAPTSPILWPGNGTTTSLTKFVAESPNPVSLCGWTGGAGLPVLAMMPEDFSTVSSSSITGPNGPLETCTLWDNSPKLVGEDNNKPTARSLLSWGNVVTVMPKSELLPGQYTVQVVTEKRTVTWSFTVDPAAALGVMPVPKVAPAAGKQNFTALYPFRLADSRVALRIGKVKANTVKLLKIAGATSALPLDMKALSANLTILNPTAPGAMTVYNCTATRPTASTVNYYPGDVTPNGGVFPLDAKGQLCIYSTQTLDLVIDVTGYFRATAPLRYEGMDPTLLVDTTTRLRAPGRLTAGQTLKVNVPAARIGVPSGSAAVAISLVGINPDVNAYITAWPCGTTRPPAVTMNPKRGTTRQNFAIVKLNAAGELCLYTPTRVDMKVEVMGWFKSTNPHMMVPTTPTRLIDTRDTRPEMNLGTGGIRLQGGVQKEITLAGSRGLPADASVLFVNVTIASPANNGTISFSDCSASPHVESITYQRLRNVSAGLQVQLSPTGSLCVKSTQAVHVIVDIAGWWV